MKKPSDYKWHMSRLIQGRILSSDLQRITTNISQVFKTSKQNPGLTEAALTNSLHDTLHVKV